MKEAFPLLKWIGISTNLLTGIFFSLEKNNFIDKKSPYEMGFLHTIYSLSTSLTPAALLLVNFDLTLLVDSETSYCKSSC